MFVFLGFLIVAGGAVPLIRGMATRSRVDEATAKRRIKRGVVVFAATVVLLIAVNAVKTYYTDLLWFRSLGFADRFWTELGVEVALFAVGAVVSGGALYLVTRFAAARLNPSGPRIAPPVVAIAGALIMGSFAGSMWESYLMFANRATGTLSDPLFGVPVHFYLFALPFFDGVLAWLIGLAGVLIVLTGGAALIGRFGDTTSADREATGSFRPLMFSLLAVLAAFLAANGVLSVFRLLYSQGGVVAGAGWLDARVRVVMRSISAGVFAVTALLLGISAVSKQVGSRLLALRNGQPTGKSVVAPAVFVVVLISVHAVIPATLNAVVVKPNEISLEEPYIARSIRFTRLGFGLDGEVVEHRQFDVARDVSQEVLSENRPTLENIRLWDWRALKDNLEEQQEIRLYYSFGDVDIDRYVIDGSYRQVMLAIRELDKSQLAEQSQTWVSRHLKYTHGYGLALTPVHELLDDGRPKLLIRNIPAEVRAEGLSLERPEIYYGEMTTDQVYVNTAEQEFDYPSGDENVYTTYSGAGGVVLDSFFKRFLFAWRFNDYQLLFSTYFTADSRVLFDRHIRTRLEKISPFLRFDSDPYPVITDDGRIVYIMDAYTVASTFPYSERYVGRGRNFNGVNYLRNSVKVVVDAYDGSVQLYIVDENDLVVQTYRKMFPGLFSSMEEMPDDIVRHIRYPEGLITVQAEIYATYHMDDPEVFYQREDVWEFATERYRDDFQRVAPYYVLAEFPEADGVEFVSILPFTPKNKNVINAWIAGRSDMPNYGKLMVFTFPKGVEVLGPRQIEARIDQNTDMSRELSLWGQRGSRVIRGNLLAIPLFNADELYLLFVEPIFLQAENASLPELKRVAVADQSHVVWSEEFEASLDLLVGNRRGTEAAAVAGPAGQPASDTITSLSEEAVSLFGTLETRLRNGAYAQAGETLDELARLMTNLRDALASSTAASQAATGEAR